MDIFSTIDSLVHSFEKVAPTFAPTGKWTQKLKDLDKIFEEMAMLSNSLHQSRKGDIKDFEVNRVISWLSSSQVSIFLFQENLEALERDIEATNNEIEKIESDIAIVAQGNERLKEEIQLQDKQKDDLKQVAMDSFIEMNEASSSIAYQKKVLYMITRLTWHEKRLEQNIIKGFVHNAAGDDVSVFELEGKKYDNPTLISDFLWDYIASGVSGKWNLK